MLTLLAQTTTTSSSDPAAGAAAIAALMGGSFLIVGLIAAVILVAIYYVIFKKTGYNPWLALLALVPFFGALIIFIILVFTEWPIQREVRALRAQLGGGGYAPPGYPPAGYPPPGSTITPA